MGINPRVLETVCTVRKSPMSVSDEVLNTSLWYTTHFSGFHLGFSPSRAAQLYSTVRASARLKICGISRLGAVKPGQSCVTNFGSLLRTGMGLSRWPLRFQDPGYNSLLPAAPLPKLVIGLESLLTLMMNFPCLPFPYLVIELHR